MPAAKASLSNSIPYLEVVVELVGVAGGPVAGASKALLGLLKILEKAGDNSDGFRDLLCDAVTLIVVLNDWRNDSPGHHIHQAAHDLETAIEEVKKVAEDKLSNNLMLRFANVKVDSNTITQLRGKITNAIQVYEVHSGLLLGQGIQMLEKRAKWNMVASILAQHKEVNASFDTFGPLNSVECLDGTRVEMLTKMETWCRDRKAPRVAWLTGPAGSGKTAAARSLCRTIHKHGIPVLSFFLYKSSGRTSLRPLLATYASQLADLVPSTRIILADIFDKDGDICGKSLETQFELLFIPLIHHLGSLASPRIALFVLDGLDECDDRNARSLVLQLMATHFSRQEYQVKVLVASRSEPDIADKFSSISPAILHIEVPASEDDVRFILSSGIDVIRQHHPGVSADWPAPHQFERLVERSSGYPIYAKVVMEYMDNGGKPPHDALEDVLKWASRGPHLEVGGFDANHLNSLFYGILAETQNQDDAVIRGLLELIVVYSECDIPWPSSITTALACDLLLVSGYASTSRKDLDNRLHRALRSIKALVSSKPLTSPSPILGHSWIGNQDMAPISTIQFYHKSFSDFLLSQGAAREYFVDVRLLFVKTVSHCLKLLRVHQYLTMDCWRKVSIKVRSSDSPFILSERDIVHRLAIRCLERIPESGRESLKQELIAYDPFDQQSSFRFIRNKVEVFSRSFHYHLICCHTPSLGTLSQGHMKMLDDFIIEALPSSSILRDYGAWRYLHLLLLAGFPNRIDSEISLQIPGLLSLDLERSSVFHILGVSTGDEQHYLCDLLYNRRRQVETRHHPGIQAAARIILNCIGSKDSNSGRANQRRSKIAMIEDAQRLLGVLESWSEYAPENLVNEIVYDLERWQQLRFSPAQEFDSTANTTFINNSMQSAVVNIQQHTSTSESTGLEVLFLRMQAWSNRQMMKELQSLEEKQRSFLNELEYLASTGRSDAEKREQDPTIGVPLLATLGLGVCFALASFAIRRYK